MSDAIPLTPGTVIAGRYELQEVLGRGSYGMVIKAMDRETSQPVALKFLLAEMGQRDAEKARLEIQFFQRELDLSKTLHHPCIVTTLDFGYLEDGRIYAVMQYIPGDTLEDYLSRRGKLSKFEAVQFMHQILQALDHAHDRGIVHRDVKPANILIATDTAREHALLFDFGLATISAEAREDTFESLTPEGMSAMTPGYASPEQFLGEPPTGQVDIYAWGLIFIECLAGKKVIMDDHPMAAMRAHMSDEPFPLPVLIEGTPLGGILHKATARHSARRYASTSDVLADLEPLLEEFAQADPDSNSGASKTPLLIGAAVAVVVVLAIILAMI